MSVSPKVLQVPGVTFCGSVQDKCYRYILPALFIISMIGGLALCIHTRLSGTGCVGVFSLACIPLLPYVFRSKKSPEEINVTNIKIALNLSDLDHSDEDMLKYIRSCIYYELIPSETSFQISEDLDATESFLNLAARAGRLSVVQEFIEKGFCKKPETLNTALDHVLRFPCKENTQPVNTQPVIEYLREQGAI